MSLKSQRLLRFISILKCALNSDHFHPCRKEATKRRAYTDRDGAMILSALVEYI